MAEIGSFLLFVVAIFTVFRVGVGLVEGNPRVVDDGFVARGGGWIDGRQASWPFVELHVTPEVIELRPRTARFFAPVRITRADQVTISVAWSPMGRGIRFDGPRLGRRTTFWPVRHTAVLEAMRQMSWPIGEALGPEDRSTSGERTPIRADHRIGYRCSPVVLLLVAPMVGIAAAILSMRPPVVFLLFFVLISGWTALITSYRIECDGVELRCCSPLWHRSIPVEDVLTIHAVGGRWWGPQSTITPRRGPRMVLLVATKRDRAGLAWFLDQLEAIAPSITVRR